MGEKLIQSFISALMGGLAAIGTVWFFNEDVSSKNSSASGVSETFELPVNAKFHQIEVDSIKINDAVFVCSPETNEPQIELRHGEIVAKNGVISQKVSAQQFLGQKLQITPGNPVDSEPPIFSELATNENGGAYFSLLSPQGTHSLNIGFDNNETGFIISQNNQDNSMMAQAILPLPGTQQSPALMNAESANASAQADFASSVPEAGGLVPNETGAANMTATSTVAASNVVPSGAASNVVPSGTASNVVPSGTASNVVPSGTASNVVPSGTASNVVPSGGLQPSIQTAGASPSQNY